MSEKRSPWGMVAIASIGALAWGCGADLDDERSIGKQVHEDFTGDGRSGEEPQGDWHRGGVERVIVTATSEGHWAVVDAWSGDVWSTVVPGENASLHDLVFDPWHDRFLSFEAYADEWGEVASYSVGFLGGDVDASASPPTLGDREVLGWLAGDARLWPSPQGPVLFELSQGSRWGFMPTEAGFAPSRVAAPPRSVWAWQDGDQTWIEALTYGKPGYPAALEVASGAVDGQGLTDVAAAALPIPLSHGAETTARMLPTPWLGGAVLADVTSAGLSLWSLPWCAVDGDCAADAAWVVPIDGQRLEQIVSLPDLEVVALLTSAPSQLVTVWLPSATGVPSYDVLPLPGDVRLEARFFSRDLLVRGPDRLLAATAEGVIAAEVATTAGGVLVELDPSFDGSQLRGPLAGLGAPGP